MTTSRKFFSLSAAKTAVIILMLVSVLFLMRMLTPDDLRNRDQVKVCAYTLDAAYNNHWICQVDSFGDITSKPPLYNWLAALMVLLFGANRFAYALPALFGTFLAAWAVWCWTRDLTSDERSGWLAVICYLFTNAVIKQLAMVRTDGLLTGFVALCAWQAWRAWETDKGWWGAWFLAALGTLAKGPFAILLGFGGLAAVFRNRRILPYKGLSRFWWAGVILPIILAGGWAWLSWYTMGPAFYNKIFVKELWGQSVGNATDVYDYFSCIKPPLYLLSRALPWAPLFLWALWNIFRHPADDPEQRRGERFILAHIGIGLLALMLAQHKRGDLVFPLLPAVAVLEGRMLGVWSRAWVWRKLKILIAVFITVFIVSEIWYLAVPRANEKEDVLGRDNKAFAEKLEQEYGRFFPFSFVSANDLKYRLGMNRLSMGFKRASKLLSGKESVFIVTEKLQEFIAALPSGTEYYILDQGQKHPYGLISNRPKCAVVPDMVIAGGAWELRTLGVVVRRMRGTTAWIEPQSGKGRLTLKNFSSRPCTLQLVYPDGRKQKIHAAAQSIFTLTVTM